MRPFLLSLLAGIWFVVLNVLNACTQPPAQVEFKTTSIRKVAVNAGKQPTASAHTVPTVKAAPVEVIRQAELPSLAQPQVKPTSFSPLPVQKAPRETPEYSTADPSIMEIIETGERLTLGNQSTPPTMSTLPTPMPVTPALALPAPVARQAATSTFIWPVHGSILSSFGSKPGGIRNDGINIAAAEGTPIHAVADGTVLYANTAMKGYGSLVLIRHSGGWISTYAHNKDILVAEGNTVKQGDIIAYVGRTGSALSPQLHFSLRKDKKPVDPKQYLATYFAEGRR